MMDHMMMDSSVMAMMCFMMGIGALIVIIVIGITIYMVTRLLMKKSRLEDRPLMLLKERYVKGEISDDEYTRMKKVIADLK
ncbi:hypothetical protein AK95_19340 [Paenibacillus sp. LC231]|uniref:SHOCT domain-containing protein n=1 Tax=Paenibacillus sp. LC231 TaxID=1120679 RepID=UPI0008DCFA19|nr:SHOCT domain-containing protein [Paenibacillus sp. LC231]OIA99324.1 hypothetical protein AK95_19340 [Paenibacillus sp. LC231]